jgi:hypothetical protein
MAGRTCSDIVKEAKSRGLWIYDPAYKKWYTPEEFHHIFGSSYDRDYDHVFKRLQIRHPSEGIQAGFQRLMQINNKLQAFTKLVIEYYKK